MEDFNTETQRIVKGTDREHINLTLSYVEKKLERLAYQKHDDEELTLDDIVKELKDEKKSTTIGDVFSEHNDKIYSLVGNQYAEGTWVKFNFVPTLFTIHQPFLNFLITITPQPLSG